MTRRFADFSRPRHATSAGEAISAGLGMVLGVIVLIIAGAFLASFFHGA